LAGSISSFAQPANDNCANAIEIFQQEYNNSCVTKIFADTRNATKSPITPDCAFSSGNSFSNDDDIWYKFTATTPNALIKFSDARDPTSIYDLAEIGMAMYNIPCPENNEDEMVCITSVASGSGNYIMNNLEVGRQYLIQLWSRRIGISISFSFCLQSLTPVPANDDCNGALPLIESPFATSFQQTTLVNTFAATPSLVPATNCGGAEANDDVWYKFVATSKQYIFLVSDITATIGIVGNIVIDIYNGGVSGAPNCNIVNGQSQKCYTILTGTPKQFIDSNFIPGNTYYVRAWTWGNGNFGTFKLGLMAVPPPPSNDDCSGAINLIPQPYSNACSSPFKANTSGATYSKPQSQCGYSEINDDIWFKFTATSSQHFISLANLETTFGYVSHLRFILIDAGPSANATCTSVIGATDCHKYIAGELIYNLTVGNTYYLRIWSWEKLSFCRFDICIH